MNLAEFEKMEQEAAGAALRELMLAMTKLPPVQVIPFMQTLVVLAVDLLRNGGKEDEFVRGLLDSALASLAEPPLVSMTDLRVN